jgi:hypothetical protein
MLAFAAFAPAAGAQWSVPADVNGPVGDQHIDYPAWASERFAAPGFTVAAVGDVNGDGLEDIAGGFAEAPNDRDRIYVTFSDRLGGVRDAAGLGGFTIRTDWFWYGLASAGDVNGDGLGDVAIVRTDAVTVVFGKAGNEPVDTRELGAGGFTITGVGAGVSGGSGNVYFNSGIVRLNDLNLDGVDDLLVQSGRNAAIVYPPRTAAGTTIDGATPGPFVSRLTADGAKQIDDAFVDTLGDVNGDGRDDVMVAGEEREGTDQVAYGVLSPLPGTSVDLPTVADTGRGFELRSHDGQPGWYGELESALTLGDQNGDGRREVGMVGHKDGLRRLRVAFTPAPGAKVDIDDLGATDSRGYRMNTYSDVIDVGDQNGDGRGDLATSSYVYFTDPSKETGTREPAGNGFSFSFPGNPNVGAIVAKIKDLNGDGRPELAVARTTYGDNCPSPAWCGQNGTYAVDVFDSGAAPRVPLPNVPVELPDGDLEVPIDLGTGAGNRGGASLGLRARLELVPASGGMAREVSETGLVNEKDGTAALALRIPKAKLRRGKEYRTRYVAKNGRGQATEGAWRSFTYGATPTTPANARKARVGGLFARRKGSRLEFGFRQLRDARGKAKVCFARKKQKTRCFKKLKTKASGKYVVRSALVARLPRGRWKMTVKFTGSPGWRSEAPSRTVGV